jgi:hypothetical protein
VVPILLALLTLAACGGGNGSSGESGSPHTIGGTISGLNGSGLALQDNGGATLKISGNGNFTFATAVAGGNSFNVTVSTQPTDPSQTCTVAHGSGTVSGDDITNVAVACTTNSFTVGGTVSGLTGSGLVLTDNGANDTPVAKNGPFSFTTALASGSAYSVTVATQPTNPPQTCTVGHASGTVTAGNISTVSVTCATNTYSVVAYVSGLAGSGLALSYNGGAAISVTRNGALIFASGVAIGTPYSLAIAGQPTSPAQTCVLSSASGTVGTTNATISVLCPQSVGQFAYVASTGNPYAVSLPGSIAVYSINPLSGALTLIPGSAVSAGPTATTLQFIPHTSFAWSVDLGTEKSLDTISSVYDYSVNSSTGLLTPVPGSPFYALDGTSAIPVCGQTFTSDFLGSTEWVSFALGGSFGYATNLPNANEAPSASGAAIWQFTIDPSSGAPSLVPGSNVAGLCNVPGLEPVTVDPSGQFAYTSEQGVNPLPNGAVYAFTINSQTGALTQVPGSPYSIAGSGSVIIDPAGRFAYVLSNAIYAYVIDPSSGALTPVGGGPFAFAATSMVISPNGQFAYLLNAGGVYEYSIGPTGMLAAVSANPAATLSRATSFAIDPSGQFAYAVAAVGSSGNSFGVYAFTINPTTGALVPVIGSPFAPSSPPGYTTAITVTN